MLLKAASKITAPRALAVALLLAAGGAASSLAVAQQQQSTGIVVNGQTFTVENIPTDTYSLGDLLSKANDKSQLVALLNLAAQKGATKGGLVSALRFAFNDAKFNGRPIATAIEAAKNAIDKPTVSNTGRLSFYEGSNPNATSAVNAGSGNNAASGSPIQTSNNNGGLGTTSTTTTTTSTVYVG